MKMVRTLQNFFINCAKKAVMPVIRNYRLLQIVVS